MKRYYLAIDIGASSGRHMLGTIENGKLVIEEIHRFSNGMERQDGELVWDAEKLFEEIKTGMKKCKEIGKIPYSVGVDTWAVDFVLLDQQDQKIGNAVAYRDERTKGIDQEVYDLISEDELYEKTGIQKQTFNTIYQLMALKKKDPQSLEKAEKMLLLPDYFHYLLCGCAVSEYTNATTTQLVDPLKKAWDQELIQKLGLPMHLFQKITPFGTVLGTLTDKMKEEIGYDCHIVLPATHDTASAVMAVPALEEQPLYISSGTWSLMGTELKKANRSVKSMICNLTNEGGYDYRFRYLRNIMGLWMIQSVRKELAPEKGFGEICEAASKCTIRSIVNCNDQRFLAPMSMTKEIQSACAETNQQIPQGIEEIAAVVYSSLAKCYANAAAQIEEVTGRDFANIYIIGGGANAAYLNKLTAAETGKTVFAGPTEATAIGNLCAQMIADEEMKQMQTLKDARECIRKSFSIKRYEP